MSVTSKTNHWNLDWAAKSPLFMPLRGVSRYLPDDHWPGVGELNEISNALGNRPVNARGERIRFVAQMDRPVHFEDKFEPRTYLRGEVLVRERNWHDLFNALVWMAFPATKAAINGRHYESLKAQSGARRSPVGDALTMFDEDGMVVLSADTELLELLRRFRWKELFWKRRDAVRAGMGFLLFGHAMYEKALDPFVGMTAKSILLHVPRATLGLENGALSETVDRCVAACVRDPNKFRRGRSLAPLPLLGVPDWWPQNETGSFYDDTSYFRSGRSGGESSGSSSIS